MTSCCWRCLSSLYLLCSALSSGATRTIDCVEASVAEWVTAQDAPRRQDQAAKYAELLQRLDRVGRARGLVLAAAGERGRDHALVRDDRRLHDPHRRPHARPAFSSSSRSAVRTPSRPSRSARSCAPCRATTTTS